MFFSSLIQKGSFQVCFFILFAKIMQIYDLFLKVDEENQKMYPIILIMFFIIKNAA